jgi:hypothetical protein
MTEFSTTATASLYQSIRDTTPLMATFVVVSRRFQGGNWDFRFSRSLPFDGTAQRKINVEHTLVRPTNPAGWGRRHSGTKIGIAAPPLETAKHALLIFDALKTVNGTT